VVAKTKHMPKTNPNGANQWQLDPRQKECWEYYTNPKGVTFGNATRSAMKAGYTDGTADTITTTEWFIGRLWRLNATFTGERKIKQLMELDLNNGGDKVDVGVARIQADLAKLLVTTQGKDLGYSTRQEIALEPDTETKEELSALSDEVIKIREAFETKLKQKLAKL